MEFWNDCYYPVIVGTPVIFFLINYFYKYDTYTQMNYID